MKQCNQKASQEIKAFIDFIDSVNSEYDYSFEAMKNEERLTQDYLHMLELDDMNYRERSKIATKLAANRQARRHFKDSVEELEPIVNFFNEPKNKEIINRLSQLLGQVRKIESYHSNRFYVPKTSKACEDKNTIIKITSDAS